MCSYARTSEAEPPPTSVADLSVGRFPSLFAGACRSDGPRATSDHVLSCRGHRSTSQPRQGVEVGSPSPLAVSPSPNLARPPKHSDLRTRRAHERAQHPKYTQQEPHGHPAAQRSFACASLNSRRATGPGTTSQSSRCASARVQLFEQLLQLTDLCHQQCAPPSPPSAARNASLPPTQSRRLLPMQGRILSRHRHVSLPPLGVRMAHGSIRATACARRRAGLPARARRETCLSSSSGTSRARTSLSKLLARPVRTPDCIQSAYCPRDASSLTCMGAQVASTSHPAASLPSRPASTLPSCPARPSTTPRTATRRTTAAPRSRT